MPGGAGQAGAQVREQRLDLVRAHGHRARQAQVVLRLHQPALRGAAARSVFESADAGDTRPAPVTAGTRAWPRRGAVAQRADVLMRPHDVWHSQDRPSWVPRPPAPTKRPPGV